MYKSLAGYILLPYKSRQQWLDKNNKDPDVMMKWLYPKDICKPKFEILHFETTALQKNSK